jgi:thiol-disulfide isomerase/thioredoxin
LSSLALAGEPSVVASARQGVISLDFVPPAGEHINDAGPFSLDVSIDGGEPLEVVGDGGLLGEPLLLRGIHVEGAARVPLCEDDGGTCRVAEVGFRGVVTRRPAALDDARVLTSRQPEPAPHTDDLDAAFAQAEAEGRLVLIDFGAVWCPPCNLMAAQVLEDPDNVDDLAPFVVVTVDADTVESWPAKARYDIGGYPTVVLTRPDGEEVDRLLGYPGEAAMLVWLKLAPDAAPLDAATATVQQAAAQARRFADQGHEDRAREWLERAVGAEESADYRLARLSLEPTAADALWLLEQQVSLTDWMWSALSIEDEALQAPLRSALATAMAGAGPAEASDFAWAAAVLATDEADEAALYGAAAATLRASLTGEPALDRGQWTSLAAAMARAGDRAGAIAFLEEAVGHYPEEFTFHYALARQRSAADDQGGTIEAARAAHLYGYGDNRLRAAKVLAEALHADGQTDAALVLLDETLAGAVVPEEGVDVRTPRYLAALEELRAELAAVASE